MLPYAKAGVEFGYRQSDDCTTLVFHRPGSRVELGDGNDLPAAPSEGVRKVGEDGLSVTDSAILDLMCRSSGVVTNAAVAEHMGMSVNGARKALQRLIDAGLVERIGKGRSTRYRVR